MRLFEKQFPIYFIEVSLSAEELRERLHRMIVGEHEREACGDDCLYRSSQVDNIILPVIVTLDVPAIDRLEHRRPRCKMERHVVVQVSAGSNWNNLQRPMALNRLEGDVGKVDTLCRDSILGKQA